MQDSSKPMSRQVTDAMLQLFHVVVKRRHVVDNIVRICDFLLLMHPAESSYVFQNRRSFFFHNKWSK